MILGGPSPQLTELYKDGVIQLLATLQNLFDDVCAGDCATLNGRVLLPGGGLAEAHLWALTEQAYWASDAAHGPKGRSHAASLSLRRAF
eukprot:7276562-Prorocentrum_lima.AAC.1